MQDKYIGRSGTYIVDPDSGEKMPIEEYNARQTEKTAQAESVIAVDALVPPTATVKKGATNAII